MRKTIKVISAGIILMSACLGCRYNPFEPQRNGNHSENRLALEKNQDADGIEIDNLHEITKYEKVPERIVALNYDAAQVLVALGLEDKIVGLATAEGSYNDCLPEYREKLKNLEVMIEGTPNFELVLSKKPDFVYGTIYSFGSKGVADKEDFKKNNIKIYCMNGTYSENPSFNDIYKDIEDLGKIFNAENRASELTETLKKKEQSFKDIIPTDLKIMAYDSGDKSPYVAGKGIETTIIELAGGNNIFSDLNRAFDEVSWEEVARRNPDIIIIHDYDTGETAGDLKEKINTLKNNPALSNVTAVKNDNFVPVKLVEVFPGIQIFDAADKINSKIREIK